ncbi:hypothetical protein BC938DRAFT_481148 [Jimgerdemannia flammicorona]|uniref:Uncharacterized protein n=1 Tax=Jimgerdemannia flammicorona TaxID=994334 RepID=A0A433QX00_9FUNG|nr:hypothetical protein BC938DRAFT_481148 [Jimgerdemannia flammicorona]
MNIKRKAGGANDVSCLHTSTGGSRGWANRLADYKAKRRCHGDYRIQSDHVSFLMPLICRFWRKKPSIQLAQFGILSIVTPAVKLAIAIVALAVGFINGVNGRGFPDAE